VKKPKCGIEAKAVREAQFMKKTRGLQLLFSFLIQSFTALFCYPGPLFGPYRTGPSTVAVVISILLAFSTIVPFLIAIVSQRKDRSGLTVLLGMLATTGIIIILYFVWMVFLLRGEAARVVPFIYAGIVIFQMVGLLSSALALIIAFILKKVKR